MMIQGPGGESRLRELKARAYGAMLESMHTGLPKKAHVRTDCTGHCAGHASMPADSSSSPEAAVQIYRQYCRWSMSSSNRVLQRQMPLAMHTRNLCQVSG